MVPRKTKIKVLGQVVEVWYLMTETDGKSASRDEKGPIASGMEAWWREYAKREDARKPGTGTFAVQHKQCWSEIADEYWPKACTNVVAGLDQCHAFCVIPSSREERQTQLVDALQARFPDAVELTYKRPPEFHFGHKREDEIFDALKRADQKKLPNGACVAIADDWAGDGTTLHAAIRRILTDHGSCIGSVVAWFLA